MKNNLLNNKTIYSVTKLTKEIKLLLEEKYAFIWVNGEISNLSKPSSGHYYFTLKDLNSQISSVIFRSQIKNLRFKYGQWILKLGQE